MGFVRNSNFRFLNNMVSIQSLQLTQLRFIFHGHWKNGLCGFMNVRLSACMLVFIFAIGCLVPNSSFATPAMRDSTYKQLAAAQAEQDKNQLNSAIGILNTLKNNSSLNGYERAMAWNMLAYIYYEQEAYYDSIDAYERVAAEKDIPEGLRLSTLYTLSQLYFMVEKYDAAIHSLQQWFAKTKKPSEEAYALLAQAYYQTSNHQLVVDNLLKAIDIVEHKNKPPEEQWLQLLQNSYIELGLAEKQIAILKWLIQIYPKKDYLLNLSSTYGILDKNREQLAVLEIAYKKGYLEQQNQVLMLASLLYSQGAPYKAAKVIERGLAEKLITREVGHLKFLASAWIAAKEHEKAIPVLEEAAKKSTQGELFRMVGNAYYQQGKWSQAATAYQKALAQNDLSSPEHLWLLTGQAHINAKEFESAQSAFEKALGSEKTKKSAHNWLQFTFTEQQRFTAYNEIIKGVSP